MRVDFVRTGRRFMGVLTQHDVEFEIPDMDLGGSITFLQYGEDEHDVQMTSVRWRRLKSGDALEAVSMDIYEQITNGAKAWIESIPWHDAAIFEWPGVPLTSDHYLERESVSR